MTARTILFVDTGRWMCFDQLGAALRRRGFRTVRVTTEGGLFSRTVSSLVYSRQIVIADLGGLGRLGTLLDVSELADVHCTEATLQATCAALTQCHAPADVLERLRHKTDHLDKFTLSTRLAAAGVDVPPSLAGSVDPASAFARLGRPLLVKGRIGFGGGTVAVVRTEEEALDAVQRFGGPDGAFFETFIPGDNVRYISCRADGVVMREATYVTRRRNPTSLGPATGVEFTDDPAMAALGRATLDIVGDDGLANIEAMRGADGVARVIDVNLRVWGSASLLDVVGLDFVGPYVRLRSGGAAAVLPTASVTGRSLDLFPNDAIAAVYDAAPIAAIGSFLSGVGRHLPVLGARYMVAAVLMLVNVSLDFSRSWLRSRRTPGRDRQRRRLVGTAGS